jgi:magnesium chelatase family protein
MLAQRFAGLLPPMTVDEALESAAVPAWPAASQAHWGAAPRARRTTRPARWRWWAAARRRGRARSRWRTTACCSSTSCPSSPAPRWRRCASRWRPATSPSPGGAARRVPGALPAGRGHEPLPLRLPRRPRLRACRCTPDQVARYQGRLSGPAAGPHRPACGGARPARPTSCCTPPGESTAAVRARCIAARERALARQGQPNQALQGQAIDSQARLDEAARAFLQPPPAAWAGRPAPPTGR